MDLEPYYLLTHHEMKAFINAVNNNLGLMWLRQTAQPYIRYTTNNSLPRWAAATTRFSPEG